MLLLILLLIVFLFILKYEIKAFIDRIFSTCSYLGGELSEHHGIT